MLNETQIKVQYTMSNIIDINQLMIIIYCNGLPLTLIHIIYIHITSIYIHKYDVLDCHINDFLDCYINDFIDCHIDDFLTDNFH